MRYAEPDPASEESPEDRLKRQQREAELAEELAKHQDEDEDIL